MEQQKRKPKTQVCCRLLYCPQPCCKISKKEGVRKYERISGITPEFFQRKSRKFLGLPARNSAKPRKRPDKILITPYQHQICRPLTKFQPWRSAAFCEEFLVLLRTN